MTTTEDEFDCVSCGACCISDYDTPDYVLLLPPEVDRLVAEGARVLGGGEPKTGAHDKPVLFLHPKDFFGTLIELEQA